MRSHTTEMLHDAFDRIRDLVKSAVDGLSEDDLAHRIDAEANSIGWLIWHLTRVEDDHVADLAGRDQAWIAEGWAERFGMAPDPHDIGYGHSSAQVAAVRPQGPEILAEYHDAVHQRTLEYLPTVDEAELDRIVDRRWDPPVTAAVRLVSIIGECYQHLGQAHYVRGIIERAAGD